MREPPAIEVRDPRRAAAPQGRDDDGGALGDVLADGADTLPRRRRAALGAALIACAASFLAGLALDRSDDAEWRSAPRLAVVTSRGAAAELGVGAQPRSTVEVTLVNTGAGALTVLGGSLRGSGPSWRGGQVLEPGAQMTAVLLDPSPCAHTGSARTASDATLVVDVSDSGGRSRLRLPVEPVLLREYDTHVRTVCGSLPVSDALSIALTGDAVDAGRSLAVPVVLQNRAVQPVQLMGVSSALDGTSAALRTTAGASVPLPLELPGRDLAELRQDASGVERGGASYVLVVAVDDGACADLLARGGATVTVALRHAYSAEPARRADTFLALDLLELLDRACTEDDRGGSAARPAAEGVAGARGSNRSVRPGVVSA